uniref:YwqG family protein n=1 Tax=Agathobacter sp. TaxID=2021311 RepID=UPI004056AA6E
MGKDYEAKVSEKAKKIVARIKEVTAMTAYKLTIVKDSTPSIFDTKFGGTPYWDMEKEYPKDCYGNNMMLLAQINFTKAELNDERLPNEGMLQFFLTSQDDCFGMDFDEPDSQKEFRIIYHEKISPCVTKEQVLALDIPLATDEENAEFSPLYKEAAVEITKTTAYLGPEEYRFAKVFAEAVEYVSKENIGSQDYYDYLGEQDRDYLFDELYNTGHWLLGYPFFTQTDPREYGAYGEYDTLLFQMDSEMIGKEDYILWGDCGVANFFINGEALKNRDFSKVMYNWDCY